MTARRTPFIGLTGSVAAGKSEALAALGRLGAATLSSDAIVHEILAGDEFTERLVERWGERVAPDGTLDRAAIGAIVFEQPRELEWLESELHPRVGERIVAWRAGLSDDLPAAVVEVPLLFETGMEPAFDATIAIVATDELRTVRAGARGTELLAGRTGRQLSQAEKAARADYAVRNDGDIAELEAELGRVLERIAARAERPA